MFPYDGRIVITIEVGFHQFLSCVFCLSIFENYIGIILSSLQIHFNKSTSSSSPPPVNRELLLGIKNQCYVVEVVYMNHIQEYGYNSRTPLTCGQ